ncbi:protein kinase [Xylographa pallens]|nr:protein kinase [Xylographa pallens]
MAQTTQTLHDIFLDDKTTDDIQFNFRDFIIGLAETFDGKRLAVLRQENKWLNEFEPRYNQDQANIDFKSSQEAFRNDGNAFLRALEEFADLYFRELVSATLLRTYAPVFVPFIAEVSVHQRQSVRLTTDNISDYDRQRQEWITKHDEEFNAWKHQQENRSTMASRGLYYLEEKKYWERSLELVESRPTWYKAKKQHLTIEKFDAIMRKYFSLGGPMTGDFYQILCNACLIKDQQNDRTYQDSEYRLTHDFEVWWYAFQKNLQHFVSLLTSKKGHLKVDENLQTLRDVNENRMRYVAMMQQTIQELSKTVNEQQQVITALKFRYLLENLPGPAYADIDKFGERWKKFWGDIATYYRKRNENAKPAVAKDLGAAKGEVSAAEEAAPAEVEASVGGGEALAERGDLAEEAALPTKVEPLLEKTLQAGEEAPVEGVEGVAPTEAEALVGGEEALAEREDPAKEAAPPTKIEPLSKETLPAQEEAPVKEVEGVASVKKSTNVEDNHTITTPALEKLFQGRRDLKYENKGRDLYSDLSEIIHRYKGNTYEIPELLFDPITSDVLRALTPNQKEDGNVEWNKEPLRYEHFAESVAEWKEEEKKKAEETKAADPVARKEKERKADAVQQLGINYAALKAQVQKLEKAVEKLKATGPGNAGDKAKEVGESSEPDREDEHGYFNNIFEEDDKEQGVS